MFYIDNFKGMLEFRFKLLIVLKLAERQRFELWMAIHHTPFPGVRLKPLGHRSKVYLLLRKNYIIFKNFILLLIQHRHIRQQNN